MQWRWGRRFRKQELEAQRLRVQSYPLNYQAAPSEMTPAHGWNFVISQAIVGRERQGPPVPGGAFERARRAVETLAFSDPRIVVQHFQPAQALRGQTVLLELRAVGLHMLCPVRVSEVRETESEQDTVFGFCFDTCVDHLERGREWFLLTKDAATGEVRFRIEAAWRPGAFPHAWMRWGFALVGRRYQRAWHHLAHLRLRERVRGALPEAHSERTPVQFWAGRAVGRVVTHVEEEKEHMRKDGVERALAMGALAGMRSMMAPATSAFLAQGSPVWRAGLSLAVLGEMAVDKYPRIVDRTAPFPLMGRVGSGALCGYLADQRARRAGWRGALLGGAAAWVTSFLMVRLRKAASQPRRLSPLVAGLVEDALALGCAALLLRSER